jgi:3-phenylpropionate/trans-cinnamate dioxygenase ferredoxin subunit
MAAPATAREIVVCSVQATIDAPILPVRAGGQQLLIVRDGDRIVACERACPHEQADLALGRCTNGKLFCPRHFAWFDLRDGTISGGWAARPLRLYPVVVKGCEIAVLLHPHQADISRANLNPNPPQRPASPPR